MTAARHPSSIQAATPPKRGYFINAEPPVAFWVLASPSLSIQHTNWPAITNGIATVFIRPEMLPPDRLDYQQWLAWTAPDDGVQIYYGTNRGEYYGQTTTRRGTNCLVRGLTAARHYYALAALDRRGYGSALSEPVAGDPFPVRESCGFLCATASGVAVKLTIEP
jgi:hypothetical protein